ncbi:pyridoxal-phosphate dependent enzyme [Dactylosporangium sp. CS-047395]|uniref:pyridoxal-phosphate dependent enzyme n=1 Tax=Dactylosporangium sp. CS-047395 TaxID=3239936 RepID=UPI003D8B3481
MRNRHRDPAWVCPPAPAAVPDFHRSLPGYAVSPLVPLPALGRVYAKQESNRFGLPAFKALGASWAIQQALKFHRHAGPVTLTTATDGNHGRAVARFAREFGVGAAVYVPRGVSEAAVQAIRDEGATVTELDGDYDAAVRAAAAAAAGDGGLLIQDTAWPGYEQVPGWIVDGYSTLFAELDTQLPAAPDVIVVPAGVGSLLQAALTHFRSIPATTTVVSVEPTTAACVAASVAAGEPLSVPTGTTVMAGLNCGTVSSLAWPYIRAGLDVSVTVDDAAALRAALDLAAAGVDAGPCGAASLAALRVLRAEDLVAPEATMVLLITEGAAAS